MAISSSGVSWTAGDVLTASDLTTRFTNIETKAASETGTETLTNKTLTSPTINNPTIATTGGGLGVPVSTPDLISNIGFTYSGGTFTITQAGGSALSSTTPGYIACQSNTSGQSVVLKITGTTHLFVDDAGSSDIIGEEFGVTTGVAWGEDRPFFIYIVNSDDTNSGVEFAISPNPAATTSPATANCGYHGNPASSQSDNNFFFFTSTDVTATHNEKPCRCIGSFRMQMSSSDDWTVQTLSDADGIGRYHKETDFVMPVSQNGAASGKYFDNNGGTAPTFGTTNVIIYNINKNGLVNCRWQFVNTSGGTAGSGSEINRLIMPYKSVATHNAAWWGSGIVDNDNDLESIGVTLIAENVYHVNFQYQATATTDAANLTNGDLDTNTRSYEGYITYKAF